MLTAVDIAALMAIVAVMDTVVVTGIGAAIIMAEDITGTIMAVFTAAIILAITVTMVPVSALVLAGDTRISVYI